MVGLPRCYRDFWIPGVDRPLGSASSPASVDDEDELNSSGKPREDLQCGSPIRIQEAEPLAGSGALDFDDWFH